MRNIIDEISKEYRLGEERMSRDIRRKVTQAITLHAIDTDLSDIAGLMKELKLSVRYYALERKDRDVIRKSVSYVRKIMRGWHRLSLKTQTLFRHGKIAPSTLALMLT